MNKKGTVVIVILISVIILFTCINLAAITRLNNRLAEMQGHIDSLRFDIHNELSGVSHIFQAMQEQAGWWEPGELELIETGPEQASVRVGWYLRDYRVGSKVFINYRRQGEEEYTALEAGDGSSGHFHVLLNLEFNPEPQWSHGFSRSQHGFGSPPDEIIEKVVPDYDPQPHYEYYISTLDEGEIRTGDVESLHLDKLFYGYYSCLHSHFDFGKNHVYVHLSEELYAQPRYTVAEARLELCKGSRVVKRLPLHRNDGPDDVIEWQADTKVEVGEDYNVLRLVVTYSDGKSFSRQTTAAD